MVILWSGPGWSQSDSLPENAQTLKWVMVSAEQGNNRARENLAVWYYFGERVPRDYATAVKWLKRALDGGSAPARKWFSDIEFDGMGAWSPTERLSWLRLGAAKGNLVALVTLGEKLFKGEGLPQDYHEAIRYLAPAAENGSARAQYLLGTAYAKGLAGSADDRQALIWLNRSAEQDFPEAQLELGRMYAVGSGVPRNDDAAGKLLRAAARQGNDQARNLLWTLLQSRRVEPRTDQEEREWIRAAAEMGDPEAQTRYGDLWSMKLNVPAHLTRFSCQRMAAFWYLKAGRQGNPRAQYQLAQMFSRGDGVETSLEKAFIWAGLAARQDNRGASDLQRSLHGQLSAAQQSQTNKILEKVEAQADVQENSSGLYLPLHIN